MIAFLLWCCRIPLVFASFLLVFAIRSKAGSCTVSVTSWDRTSWPVTALRWIIATLTSIAVIGLHIITACRAPSRGTACFQDRRWQQYCGSSHRGVGEYLHRFGNYDVIYGSVATAIALLIWLYLVSMVILIGAEFNAVRYPRFLFGAHSEIGPSRSGFRPLMMILSELCTIPSFTRAWRKCSRVSCQPLAFSYQPSACQ